MPYYDYICDEHGKFELRMSMNEVAGATPPCPECGSEMHRKFHRVKSRWKNPSDTGRILDPDMNEQEAEDALYNDITETYDD